MNPKRRAFPIVLLIGSIALNIGFLTVFAAKYFAKPPDIVVRACPMASEYAHFYISLGLDDEQLRKIESMAHDFHGRIDSLSSTILDRRNKLILEIRKDEVDKAAIDSLHADIAQTQTELQQLVVEHFLDMKSVMNDEQKRKFFAAMEKSFVKQDFGRMGE